MGTGLAISNNGKKIALNRTFKASPDYTAPTVFKVGIGTTTPTSNDTDLETPVPLSGEEIIDDCETADWSDSADMSSSLNSSTYKIGSNSLNLTKDGTASVNASVSKTTTSLDFSDKKFEFFLYIDDTATLDLLATTDCLTIRFGSDASNYYQWTRNKAELSIGWNYINNITDDNEDSTTGTPDNANSDYSFIQLTTTLSASTWTAGKVAMDDLRLASSGDFTQTFVSGYPVFDETNIQATTRALLNSLEANGQELTEFGLFNTDATELMWGHSVHTALTKSSSTEISYVQKDKII